MTPVACAIANREEDGDVLRASLLESLVPPRIPINRVVRVLQQVGAVLGSEAVRLPTALGRGRGRGRRHGGCEDAKGRAEKRSGGGGKAVAKEKSREH